MFSIVFEYGACSYNGRGNLRNRRQDPRVPIIVFAAGGRRPASGEWMESHQHEVYCSRGFVDNFQHETIRFSETSLMGILLWLFDVDVEALTLDVVVGYFHRS